MILLIAKLGTVKFEVIFSLWYFISVKRQLKRQRLEIKLLFFYPEKGQNHKKYSIKARFRQADLHFLRIDSPKNPRHFFSTYYV